MKVILHFTNGDKYSTDALDDDCEGLFDEWNKAGKDAFQTIEDAWIRPRDVLWIEFPE